jgi:hypothetical protein
LPGPIFQGLPSATRTKFKTYISAGLSDLELHIWKVHLSRTWRGSANSPIFLIFAACQGSFRCLLLQVSNKSHKVLSGSVEIITYSREATRGAAAHLIAFIIVKLILINKVVLDSWRDRRR